MEIKKPEIVEKPWGREIWIAVEDEYAGKILEIKKGTQTSVHYHREKKETMYVLKGILKMIGPDESFTLNVGESITVHPGERHRLLAIEDLEILEVSTTELDDVVRVEDDYGRG